MGSKVLGQHVFKWPEFRALCERLEIDLSLPTTRIIIDVGLNAVVEVQQTFMGRDAETEG